MLLAHEITGGTLYIDEAKAALKALEGNRFNLAYQTNLTAWGAVACLKLWNSEIEHAKNYTNFFGLICLHDAPYMAAYECFEGFSAFDEYLRLGYDDIPPAAKLLLCEYRRFAQDFTWCFYPDALPEEAVVKDNVRNGYNDCKLSFSLEDLYGDGQPAGQAGRFRLLKKGRWALPRLSLTLAETDISIPARQRGDDFRDYEVPADATLIIRTSTSS